MSRKTCEEYAARCVLLAEETHDAVARLGLIGMARGWLRLAQQAEKNTESSYGERLQLGRSPKA